MGLMQSTLLQLRRGIRIRHYVAQSRVVLTDFIYFDIFRMMKSKNAMQSLAALAQESRLAIFRMLVKRGPDGYTPTEIGEQLNVASPTLSFHLKELLHSGLIDVRRKGRFLYYRPNFSHMNQLIGFLSENCCVLADQGCGPECAPAFTETPLTRKQDA